jgi:16S rRNA (cytosine1402-N4)-methyltransferase
MTYHKPVLLKEAVTGLQPRDGGVYVDGTVGDGGHAEAILAASAPTGRLVGLDRDEEAIEASRRRLRRYGNRVHVVRAEFANMKEVLHNLGYETADGVLLDLGVSSRQLEIPARGFSFSAEGPLDMRMSRSQKRAAADIVADASAEELTKIFREYGEERRAAAVARAIVRERARKPVATTTQLAAICERVLGKGRAKIHPATKIFQALRIAVNDELEQLRQGLEAAVELLKSGGRLAVISFHSLEDRIVKEFFARLSTDCVCPPDFPVCVCHHRRVLRVVTRRPITPAAAEIAVNPRSRSARLRIAEKI